jgi:CO/xanthine dehydrogenase FAD-binding subunit
VYSKPRTIEQALSIRSSGKVLVVCGGTDVYPAHADRPFADPVLDLSDIESLRGISRAGGIFRIGAAATWTDVISAPLPAGFDGLKAAAREVGSLQIQNRGTVAGNICNASPAADGIPPLLSLDASVELQSLRGQRLMPLSEFVTGYRRTALAPDEIVSAILVPAPAGSAPAAIWSFQF